MFHKDIDSIEALIFDFDGVLTNNLVHLNQEGEEFVSCNRSDGLAFDVIRKLNIPAYIISTEKNLVVTARAKKLNIPLLQGISNKADCIIDLSKKQNFNLEKLLYVGNDLNDYYAMQLCGYSACPNDSHKRIRSLANVILNTRGGYGVVRELLEEVLEIDFLKVLYSK
jgi:3-deoxy-D-manno-octulosonate 8-phosphate phosphatase (KDO 8-P phosphatase)